MTIEKYRIGCIAITAALAIVLPYQASAGPAENIMQTDLNGDGAVDRGEYHRRMSDRFFMLDKDRDGALRFSEVEAAGPEGFAEADSDGNRVLSLREYMNSRFLDFDDADENGDGILSSEEVRSWAANKSG